MICMEFFLFLRGIWKMGGNSGVRIFVWEGIFLVPFKGKRVTKAGKRRERRMSIQNI